MKTIFLLGFFSTTASAYPGPQIQGQQINPQSSISIASETVTGQGGLSVTNGVTATSATLTGTAATVYDVDVASGAIIRAGTLQVQGSGGINAQSNPIVAGASTLSSLALGAALPATSGGTGLSSAGGTANRVLRTSNGSTFVTGQVVGPDIAQSTVSLALLNQSGATDGQLIQWVNADSQWEPKTVGVLSGLGKNQLAYPSSASTLTSDPNFVMNGTSVTVNEPLLFGPSAAVTAYTAGNTNGNQILTLGSHPTFSGIEYSQVVSTSGLWNTTVGNGGLTIAGLDANAHYQLVIDSITMNGANDGVLIRFGTSGSTPDSGSNYSWTTVINEGGSTQIGHVAGDNKCVMNFTTTDSVNGYSASYVLDFMTSPGQMTAYGGGSYRDAAGSEFVRSNTVCAYTTSSAIVNISIIDTGAASRYSGTIHLKRVE